MTDTLAPALSWQRTPQGLWIASTDNRPMGIVTEKSPHRFVATSRSGKDLGTHRTLEEARAALEGSL